MPTAFCSHCGKKVAANPASEGKDKPQCLDMSVCRLGCEGCPADTKPAPPANAPEPVGVIGEGAARLLGVELPPAEPMEPWVKSDAKKLQLHEQTGHGNIVGCILKSLEQIEQLQRKHDALDARLRKMEAR